MHEGWCITRDCFYEEGDIFGIGSRVGYGQIDYEQVIGESRQYVARSIYVETDLKATQIKNPVRIRLIDEDDEIHYYGVISQSWLDGVGEDEALAFAPLTFAETDTGATIMQYREDSEWKTL
jgi:hypothetical protein